MSTLEKLKEKFNEKPIPNNISFGQQPRLILRNQAGLEEKSSSPVD